MNAANEVAVAAFLKKTIQFVDIPRVINETLDAMDVIDHPSLQSIIESDSEARQLARTRLQL